MGNSSGPDADVYGDYQVPESVGAGDTGAEDQDQGQGTGGDGSAAQQADDSQDDRQQPPPRRAPGSDAGTGAQGGKPTDIPMHRYEELEQRVERLTAGYESRVRQLEHENRRFRTHSGWGRLPARSSGRTTRVSSGFDRKSSSSCRNSRCSVTKNCIGSLHVRRTSIEWPRNSRRRRKAESRRWGGHAERMVRSVLNHAATQWMGAGKTPETRARGPRRTRCRLCAVGIAESEGRGKRVAPGLLRRNDAALRGWRSRTRV